MKSPLMLLSTIESAINNYIALDPQAAERFIALEGRVVGIELRGLDLKFYLLPGRTFQVVGDYAGEPDVWIVGAPLALMRLTLSDTKDGLFGGDVEISGDSDLGHRFQQLLERIEVDWEEHLSHLTGDVIAHQLGNLFRGALKWGEQSSESLRQDLSEYLREEQQLLPNRDEVEAFMQGVDETRMAVERFEMRFKRLRERVSQ
ncbi:ubiquinone biosynthesis accessory factor UbiJ [Candidatus Reidiella endopervernicosa]|uniref:Ubiquinone biosynthesis accessory factor UbiJ n=1 Tax=Candidatus Reidiella endopervernicosa TaxID=2738883 RepID=A0A6N0HSR1_9GAMM|nr:SCP2 sterol-binding domain-containing protein [Candidatus Reidiella endopervernicosa]QKQ25438.1 SCP2 sterol-binding domain-containing protein [Candidatus Reidiella endopervernicosa]